MQARTERLEVENQYIVNFMGKLTPTCDRIFLIICFNAWGHYAKNPGPMKMGDIIEVAGLSKPTVIKAIKELEDHALIKVVRVRGRGKINSYDVDFETLIKGKDSLRKDSLGKEIETIHGFSDDLFLTSPPCPEEKTATPSPTAKVLKLSKPKRSEEEWAAFHDLWAVFEKAIGCKISGKDAALEAKSIWELIDRKRDGNGRLSELKEIVCKFIEMHKSPPDGLEYLGKLLPLPHILNSTRTWLNVTTKEIAVDRTPTKEETAEYVKSIREKCGKK